MSWLPIRPTAPSLNDQGLVMVSVGKGPKQTRRAFISIRRALLKPGELDWWKAGLFIDLQIGEGEHAGTIRLCPGSDFKLAHLGRQAATDKIQRVSLSSGALAQYCGPDAHRAAVEYQIGPLHLDITVPSWMQVKPPVKQQPFRGIGSTGPNPHPLMRRPGT